MIPPEHFHSCRKCQKFSIDIDKKQICPDPSSDNKGIPSDIFFFDATLEDVLNGLTEKCELCLWLDSLWAGNSSSNKERYGLLKGDKNTSSIVVCAETYSMSLVDRYPVDDIAFFGLWEEDAALHPHWGKCLVFAKCSVDVFTTRDNAASHLIHNRPISRFPGSADNLGLARQWLQKCQTSHAKCKNVSSNYMPLRVLRISNGCGSCEFRVVLETTTKNKSIQPFAALSYCWGGDQPYKTTKARMLSGNLSLEWRKIPKSVQDAIRTTAALGLQCLVSDSRSPWADSLCIIQDDEDDKALQISDMARVYSQATVTIVASRANRAIDGFLGEINLTPQTRLAVRLPFRCPGQEQTVGSAYLTHIDGTRDSSEPIDSRAWTLQERYLSNRVLEFGSRQTRWTCAGSSVAASPAALTISNSPVSTTTARDSYTNGWKWDKNPESHDSQMIYLHNDLLSDLAEFAIQRSSTAWVREWLHSRWETVLSEYTSRLLSVPTDRILAISGVAEIFLSHLRKEGRDENEEYLAGIWKSSLPSMLCWHAVATEGVDGSKRPDMKVVARDRLPPCPQIYQGPSWSWVGINCHVSFILGRSCQRDCRAVLLDTDVRLTNASAKCGFVSSAILTVKGRMRQCFWSVADGTLHVDINQALHVGGENRNASSPTTKKVRLATMYLDTSDFPSKSPRESGFQVPVWLLEVGYCVGLKRRGPVGLVLEPVNVSSNKGAPRFRRRGLFHIDTRQVQGASQQANPSLEHSELEDEMNFFEKHTVNTIQLE
ncbi:heterokaryon incompatibility protein-domain-containing protein [Xylaria sp. FL1777]|nr:heterokaryon incompatibility protein-domain-containing protein [Xylaria sp. FL1777]